jgi:lactoylglutathione lyase
MATPTRVALSTIGYVILYVRNAEKAIAFYQDQLGLKVKLKEGNWVELDTGKTILALHVDEKAEFPAEPKGPTCVVFNVEDIYATYEHLKSAGVKFEEEPKQVCEMGPGQIGVSADFRDLDENLLSIFGAVKKK